MKSVLNHSKDTFGRVHNLNNQLLQIDSSTIVGCILLLDPPWNRMHDCCLHRNITFCIYETQNLFLRIGAPHKWPAT